MSELGVEPFLIIWIAIGTVQAMLLLLFPAAARTLYIDWKELWGLRIDPESPILSDGALRIFGVLTLVIVIVGAALFSTQGV